MLDWRVWDEVPVEQSYQRTGKKPLGGKWVDGNKGDASQPVVRCRYVAQEIAFSRSDDFFAATPPLEALRLLISHAASNRKQGYKILVMDARKAHLHAYADREIYVELPPEIRRPGFCAKLRRCLYGTRDAPARWEAYLAQELVKAGFTRGGASACCFHHKQRDLRCIVHGDDFVFVGSEESLKWIEEQMGKSFLVKVVGKLGGDESDLKELCILNRVLRWTKNGITYEADPRHAELLIKSLAVGKRQVRTPGLKRKTSGVEASVDDDLEFADEDEPLTAARASLFRSCAARANYLGMDRPDLAFASKELCRRMSAPREGDLEALRRLAQYLLHAPRIVYEFKWQEHGALKAYVDTDFAGCLATRRSTSGGCIMHGSHLIKHWATTQKVVTLSSGEAELAGVVKGVGEALGLQSYARDLGTDYQIEVHADSSAAIGICRRSGIGKVRHLAVGQLWVQEKLRAKEFSLYKVLGLDNPADMLTKHISGDELQKHQTAVSLRPEAGRADSAPKVNAEVDTSLS